MRSTRSPQERIEQRTILNMCGLAGFLNPSTRFGADMLQQICRDMTDCMRVRGPDDSGVWHDAEAGIALGHRRLSIVDLSALGHQPMVSASGRMLIAYNGEVYNFAELRAELEAEGVSFRSSSDTEVILEACERWGVEQTVPRLIGMFAFALWDRRECQLILVRDRLGIKPLYWGWAGKTFVFGSELKALRQHPEFKPTINRDALAAFLRHAYVPAPHSIYRGVRKLQPGCILSLKPNETPIETAYWRMENVAREGQTNRLALSDDEAVKQLDTLLRDAVGRRMVADVPLGAFLSGGVDSSTVVALMQTQSKRPVRTFSIGFHEDSFNEAQHAKAVANHLGTDHTELYVDSAHALGVIPSLPKMFDEPFADSSQIPTFLVSEMTRKHVTVSLSGDGGDEFFAGYNRYALASSIWKRVGWMPDTARSALGTGIQAVPPSAWNQIFRLVPESVRPPEPGDKMLKLATVLQSDPAELYRRLISQWNDPDAITIGGQEYQGALFDEEIDNWIPNQIERMQYLDSISYLPDDILTKVDRASMAVSLEARVPLIDHRVVEFAWRLPLHQKVRNGQTKWLLRQVLYRYVPRHLIERPKMGFGVPIDSWLRGPLRDWAESLLSEKRLREEGFFEPGRIRQKWEEHILGKRAWHYPLWTVLMFQAWLENQKADPKRPVRPVVTVA